MDLFICQESKRSPLPEHRGSGFLTAPRIFQIAFRPRSLFLFVFLPFSLSSALLLPGNFFSSSAISLMNTPEKGRTTCAFWSAVGAVGAARGSSTLSKDRSSETLAFKPQKCWQVSVGLTYANPDFAEALTEAIWGDFQQGGKRHILDEKAQPCQKSWSFCRVRGQ